MDISDVFYVFFWKVTEKFSISPVFPFHPKGIFASEGEHEGAVKDIVPCKIFYWLTPERVLLPFITI